MTTGVQRRTLAEYRAEQRQRAPVGNPLDEYDPAYSARVIRGTPRGRPFCTCGSEKCLDKGIE